MSDVLQNSLLLQVYTEEGIVTIQALEQKWLQPTTDVLTEAFADAKGYTQYRWG